MASEAPIAVVLRRGPSNAVCSILWNRSTDEFEVGQWLRGRIYERRADISPDGRHLIYFARGGGARHAETRGSWTAVSRVRWLKAIVLHGKGDCWQGGGLFTANSRYWLNGCHFPVRHGGELKQDRKYKPEGQYGGECPSVYYRRLQRDGWVLKDTVTAGRFSEFTVFEKALPRGWILRKYAHAEVGAPPGKGCYWDEHELEHPRPVRRLMFPKWEWAERDGQTLVWAEDGRLCRADLKAEGPAATRVLYDFNSMEFERRIAPY